MKKLLYIILDGASGLPVKRFGNRTCLETAYKKNMDGLARNARCCMLYPVDRVIAPESDSAVLSLLGYDVKSVYTGRGPLEAIGSGMDFRKGDLAFRANFATAKNGKIIDRRCGRNLTAEEAAELTKLVNREVKIDEAEILLKNTIGHRAVLLFRGKNLSDRVSNFDPAYVKEGNIAKAVNNIGSLSIEQVKPLDNEEKSTKTAELINRFIEKSMKVLENAEVNIERRKRGLKEANLILFRDGGTSLPAIPTIESNFNVKLGAITEMPVERGIASLSGMKEFYMPLSGEPYSDSLMKKAELIHDHIDELDGFYIHLKGPDEPAHDGNCEEKVKKIEEIDRFFFEHLLNEKIKKECIIAITADHSTPCIKKGHSADPVPLLIYNSDYHTSVNKFSEADCSRDSSIPVTYGNELLRYLVNELKK